MADEQAVWRRNERWTGPELDDSLVVVDPESGKYFVLNRTAAVIW